MPLPGGAADKAGSRFERLWSVLVLCDLLRGACEKIRFEIPGPGGYGFEFRVLRAGTFEWHQVKRQRSEGDWSVAALASAGVLRPWWAKVRAGERCVFVSGTSATALTELVERASQAASFEEFAAHFRTGQAREAFQRLCTEWGSPPEEEVFRALPLVEVEVIGESQLGDWVRDRLEPLVEGAPATVLAVLDQLVSMSTHRELTTDDVWQYLEEGGFTRRRLSQDVDVGQRLAETVEALQARQDAHYIGGQDLPRAEAGLAFRYLAAGKRVLVAGAAGSGKSVVALQVMNRACEEGWPVLALSADSAPAGAATPREWGMALGLPDSPVTVLAGVAAAGGGLLVVDQLDAIGAASGRHPERRDLLATLLRQAASHPGIRVLVACRRFDLDHDRVLRGIAQDAQTATVEVGELDEQVVHDVLAGAGVSVAAIPARVAQLLRVPLHLALYTELVGLPVDLAGVASLTDLYTQYCEEKRRACRTRRDGLDEWQHVVDVLVERMSADQDLSAPAAVLNSLDHQREVMCSEGVLTQEGRRVRFFHETLFDHLFAECFVGQGQTLRGLLECDEQELFRRAQVRQILAHERATRPTAYQRDLEWLLTSPDTRLHLKVLAVTLNQVTADPRAAEWALLRPIAVDDSHLLHNRLWGALRRNPAWFPTLDDAGEWTRWLTNPGEQVVNRTVWALTGMAAEYPHRVVELIRTMPATPQRPQWMRMFLQHAPIHQARELVDLMVEAISSGLLDADGVTDVWHTVKTVADHDPGWAIDLLRALLARLLDRGMRSDPADMVQPQGPWATMHGHGGEEAITQAARRAPEVFVDRLLPVAIELIDRHARARADRPGPRQDVVWHARRYGTASGLLDELFSALAWALAELACLDPVHAESALAELRAVDVDSAFVLVAAAYGGNPQYFADQAVDWLVATPSVLGMARDGTDHWVARLLIVSVSPHCSGERLDRLVDALIWYAPVWERTYQGLRYRGWAELCLLNGLDPARIPERAARRLAEVRRKFNRDDVPGPDNTSRASIVPPPVAEDRARRMSDAHWLKAMAAYGDGPAGRSRSLLAGGVDELAQVLENLTKEDPERFAQLLLKVPAGTSESYVCAILRGITSESLSPDLLLKVVSHARDLGRSEVNRWAAWLIQAQAAADLPAELIAIAADIAVNDPDPKQDSDWSGGPGDAFEVAGMNCARGAAALAVAALIDQDPTRLPLLNDALEHLVADPILHVRAMAAQALWPVLHADADLAVRLLLTCVAGTEDRLLTSRYVEGAIHRAIHRGHAAEVLPAVARMVDSTIDGVRRAGGRQLAVATYPEPDLDPLIDAVLTGAAPAVQLGAVEVFAANAFSFARRDRSLAITSAAFNNPAEEIRATAAQCFRRLPDHPLDDDTQLLSAAFVGSPAFPENAGELIRALDHSTQPTPEWALDPCERYLEQERHHVGDISRAAAVLGASLVKIVTRVYAQHPGPEPHRRCLNLLDQLLAAGAHNIDKTLESIER